MSKLEFYQTNYIAKNKADGTEIKICPVCSNVFSVKEDVCSKCKMYLPSFPTSWVRSATNIYLLRKVLEFIHKNLNGICNTENLTRLLIDNYIISVDLTRINEPVYWRGGPRRRAAEYISNLQYLNFLKKNDGNFEITESGKSFILAEDVSDYLSVLSKAFLELKIANEYDKNGFYSEYNNHILFQSLRIIDDLSNKNIIATIENIALAIMSKDEDGAYDKALETSLKYSHKEINKYYFSRGKEFNRVVKGVFVRWLNQSKLINITNKERTIFLELTEFGKEIFNKYKVKYLTEKETGGILTPYEIRDILEKNIEQQYLRLKISSEVNNRAGAVWENIVKENLNKIGLDVKWYKETTDFVNIELPPKIMASLTGGTRHNPDLILHNPLWLIDPKKDVNMEMHKVMAYDEYAEIVDGLSIIVTQKMMRTDKAKMMKDLDLKKVLVLDGYALQVLSDNTKFFTKDKVISIIDDCKNNIHYINEEVLFEKYV
jgi:hypothetical protein